MAKRKHVRAIFQDVDKLSSEDIAKSQALKDLLKTQVPVCIFEAHIANRQVASVFEINDSDHYIEIHKRDWPQALETCIIWYLETEEYEKCTKLRNMIEEIQKKPTKKLNIKKENDGE